LGRKAGQERFRIADARCSAEFDVEDGPPLAISRGKNQIFITPGVLLGRIRLYGRLTLTVGTGYQFAVSDAHPQYENNRILSVRTNF
jgi:hypothetical protein